jgi:multidrug efflux system outer membrane protein
VRPDLPVPTQWPAALGQVQPDGAGKVHWKTYFPDPRLQALIGIALNNNRDLRIAAARVQEARAQVDLAAAERLPSINLQGGATLSGSPGALLSSGTPSINRRFDVSLNTVAYEMDFWGRLASLNDAAKSTFLATQEAQRAFELSLVAEVANTYFTQLQLEEWSRLARDTLELREQSFAVVSRGRDLGGSYDFEVAQTQAAMESARASVDAIAHQWTTTTNRLHYLLGEVPKNLPAGWDLEQQGVDSVLVAGVPGEVLLLRPDVMAAEQRLLAAQANIEAARAAFLPRVLLTSGVGLDTQGLST